MNDRRYAKCVIAAKTSALDRCFHYEIPERFAALVQPGTRVLVPFGNDNKRVHAVVMELSEDTDIDARRIKPMAELLDTQPVFSREMLELALWMKDKYYTTLYECLRCIIPGGVTAKHKDLVIKTARLTASSGETAVEKKRLSSHAQSVLKLLSETGEMPVGDIKLLLSITDSPIKTLEAKGLIEYGQKTMLRNPQPSRGFKYSLPTLTQEQNRVVQDILSAGDKHHHLIRGVTGSGKTEVYMTLIEAVVKQGKQAIMLVPEIALTPQTVAIFYKRFGELATVTHSRLSDSERYDQWKRARDGHVSIMIGPRSAVFAPFGRLGLIVIDEEHEHTYKSEVSPKYNTKEVAIKRAEAVGATVVLGSATPCIESYFAAKSGGLMLHTMPTRINNMPPNVHIIDMRVEMEQGNRSIFGKELSEALLKNIRVGKQSILFINRRGHSTFVSCRSCGHVLKCDDCNVNYTYHIAGDLLICHYCGAKADNVKLCPVCGSKYIKYFGVGTQKVQEEFEKLFPGIKTLRMDMDTTSNKNGHEKILTAFRNGEADVLIGTQMIAKGLDFPNVTVVGVVAADISLNAGDFRAGENTFSLLTQVAGRAGRADSMGHVYIQTYNPEHYAVSLSRDNDYEQFYRYEIALRRQMNYPPYTHIFCVLATSESEKSLIVMLFKLKEIMQAYNKKNLFEMIGPAPAFISRINRKYRWKIIIKSADEDKLKRFVLYTMEKLRESHELSEFTFSLTMDPSMVP